MAPFRLVPDKRPANGFGTTFASASIVAWSRTSERLRNGISGVEEIALLTVLCTCLLPMYPTCSIMSLPNWCCTSKVQRTLYGLVILDVKKLTPLPRFELTPFADPTG